MQRALVAVGLVAWFVACPARAQEADARALFEQGVSALDEGRFADAAELLARSLEIRDSLSARFNRAVALRGAGRHLEAIGEIEVYLEGATAPRYARSRAHAEAMLEELRAGVAELALEVVGNPDEVRVDGEPVAMEQPSLIVRRDPGPVHVRVSREGYASVDRTVELGAGARERMRIDAAESPLPARLTVDATPARTSIALDGIDVGAGHAAVERPAGTYQLTFSNEGFVAQEREVTLAPGQAMDLTVVLTEVPASPIEEQWWFWTLVGGGALAVAAATVIAIVVANDNPQLELGSLGFSQEVLRWSM